MRCVITAFIISVFSFLCIGLDNVSSEIGPYHGKVVVCYWSTWSIYRPNRGKFQLEDVHPALCTHLILAFTLLNVTDYSVSFLGTWPDLDVDENGTNNVMKLKREFPHLRVMVAIGGWQDGSIKYSKMAADPQNRKIFVNNTLEFIQKHGFDGLDLVWEYPTKRGGGMNDKMNFVELIKDLKAVYQKHNLLLTAALGASKDTIDNGYDVSEISPYLDYMLMMTYDYKGRWSRTTGPNAPLNSTDLLNVDYTIQQMLKLGADANQLILGIPFYGRTFNRIVDAHSTGPPRLGEKFKDYTFNGSYTQEEGFMGYNEICLELFDHSQNWTRYWDDESKTPYAVSGEKLIVYDSDRSIAEKIKYAMQNRLGGVMVWSIDTDDFHGDCYETVEGYRDYPLLRTIDREIHRFISSEPEQTLDDHMAPLVSGNGGASMLNVRYTAALSVMMTPLLLNWCYMQTL